MEEHQIDDNKNSIEEELIEEIDKLKKRVKELEKLENKVYFDMTNIFANVLYPISIYILYIFLKDTSFKNIFENSLFSLNTTLILLSVIVNTIVFYKILVINNKLWVGKVFKKLYIKN